MKITKVEIKEFHQFKDLTIDLTYPKGHAKEGKPLEKVCIIGQSGTGKTTLLNILSGYTFTDAIFRSNYNLIDFDKNIYVDVVVDKLEIQVSLGRNKDQNLWYWGHALIEGTAVNIDAADAYFTDYYEKIKTKLIFSPADLKYDDTNVKPSDLSNKLIIDFRTEKASDIWSTVFAEIQKYQEEELRLQQEIAKVAVEGKVDIKKIQASVKQLEDWKKGSANPLNKLADECLDQVLHQLKLRVSRKDFTFDSKENIGTIKIEDLNGNEVPYSLLSTGTKQIMLTALPLYFLKPDNTLIFVDEPERSLYPSLQKFIIDYYISLTKESQFFFATHSPIIASSFEPWEIIELKFNDEGKVYQEQYYPKDAERHVDNYTIIPSYLTYDLMLSKVFDVDATHSYERSEKITEVLTLRNRLLKHKEKGTMETPAAKKTYDKYRDLAGKLFWDFEIK